MLPGKGIVQTFHVDILDAEALNKVFSGVCYVCRRMPTYADAEALKTVFSGVC
jgi:hypothetical protein